MKLRAKFTLVSSSLITVVVLGMTLALINAEKKQVKKDIQQEQLNDLAEFKDICNKNMLTTYGDELVLINYAKFLLDSPRISFAGYVSRDGSGWLYSRPNKMFHLSDIRDYSIKAILDSKSILEQEVKTDTNDLVISLSQPVGNKGYVRLGYSKTNQEKLFSERIRPKIWRFIVIGLISILFGFGLSQILSSALSKPVQLLTKAASEIAHGQKGVQIRVEGKDELAKLTETFNNMSKELSKLDEMKDDFMSHVTHELRSPLTSIIATVELMAEMPNIQKDPRLKRSVDRLVYGSERLNKLVDNILDLTKMEAGKMQFDIQPADMGKILLEMADFFEPRAMEKNLAIRAHVPRNLPLGMADPERIRQVLSNLIHNALKFTNQGEVVLWVKAKADHLEIGVQDTGVGIPADKLNSVFAKFECLQDTRNRVDKPVPGSGLGLNIVLNSVKSQGGKIWVESEWNKGSTFIFTLPLAPADIQAKHIQNQVDETALGEKEMHLADEEKPHPKKMRLKAT